MMQHDLLRFVVIILLVVALLFNAQNACLNPFCFYRLFSTIITVSACCDPTLICTALGRLRRLLWKGSGFVCVL